MTQFKGTPGPWYCESNSRAIGPLIQGDDDQCFHMLEHVAHVEYQMDEDIQHYNARLIAAAPELLEALQDLQARACIYVNTSKAKAAIAKATGETK